MNMSNSPEGITPVKPRGIALLICWRTTWQNPTDPTKAHPRDIYGTLDALAPDHFPCSVGPMSAYVLVSGAGSISLSLMLEAPNGEFIVAHHLSTTNWGTLGTCEWSVHISEFPLNEPGIYHWQLFHGDEVLLDRPMLVTLRA